VGRWYTSTVIRFVSNVMTTKDIAERLVALNRANDHETVYRELCAPELVSVENWDGMYNEYVGMEAIAKKAADWMANVVEMHEVVVSEPLVADQSFAVTFYMDVTFKDRGREKMTELAVYKVRGGKIVREEFQA
jgi:hypothetical protein